VGILNQGFSERLHEIEEYLDFLSAVESEMRNGIPKVGSQIITESQQRMLLSSVYLQLYNLVEATISKCIDAVCSAVTNAQCRPSDLTSELLKEWVRYRAQTHSDLNYDNRLNKCLEMCNHLLQTRPVSEFQIRKGGGGNWSDCEIFDLSKRIGCNLNISNQSLTKVKQQIFDGDGALVKIVKLRNKLAHGDISFQECGANTTISDLRDIKERAVEYLTEVVNSFECYIASCAFLSLNCRSQVNVP
jgi:hypothetical protein